MFKFNKNYQDLAQVELFFTDFKKVYNELRSKKEYPYNSHFEGKIEGIRGDDEKTAIYLLQHLMKNKEKTQYEEKMKAEGWEKLTTEKVKEAIENKKKILLNAEHTNDWQTIKVEKKLKAHCFNGNYGLMELKAKTRGYALSQFENAFCKLVD